MSGREVMEERPIEELETRIGYSFKDRTLLETALSHSSYANENRRSAGQSNERLEFLGDAVLGQIVANHLYLTYPEMPEGQMTRLRAELVCEQSLHQVALRIGLGDFLRLVKGEEHTGGRQRPSILADAVEAVMAAMYLDGGTEPVREFIGRYILSEAKVIVENSVADYKTALQELVQKKPGRTLSYELVSESGPDHNKTFTVKVMLDGEQIGEGTGHTKKEAEQFAAKSGIGALEK